MIDLIFQFAGEYVLVRIRGNQLFFMTQEFGSQWAELSGLQFNKQGVIKEHPDLKDNPEWKTIALQRLKDKIALMKDEKEIENYVIHELRTHGYTPKYRQQNGFRKEAIR